MNIFLGKKTSKWVIFACDLYYFVCTYCLGCDGSSRGLLKKVINFPLLWTTGKEMSEFAM